MKYAIPFLIVSAVFLAALAVFALTPKLFGAEGGIGAGTCTLTASTTVAIGDDISTEVLSGTGRRAWAIIELPQDSAGVATNTVAIGFGQAAIASNFRLSTTTKTLEFGKNTSFTFQGSINALTDTGSTTIRVIECSY